MIYTYQHINILMIVLSDRTLVITTIIIPLSSGPAGHLATNAMIVVGVLMPPLVASCWRVKKRGGEWSETTGKEVDTN
jgi:hypothetical protein